MPNIPINQYPTQAQKHPQNKAQYNTAQIRNVPSRQAQPIPRAVSYQPRPGQVPSVRTGVPRPTSEQVRPMKPAVKKLTPPKSTVQQKQKKHPKKRPQKKRDRTTMGDFLLSFIVALFVFGVAAIFVCNALISLFAS